MTGSTLNPLGPIAGAYCLDNSEVPCIMGPVGSMKTTASMLRLARHAWAQEPWMEAVKGSPRLIAHTRFGIVRNTGPQLADTTMKSWFKLFPTDNRWRKWTSTQKTATWYFPIGKQGKVDVWMHSEFMFRALDDPDDIANLRSLEVTGFYFNELSEIDTDIFTNSRARYGRFPGGDMGGCTWKGQIADTNPWSQTSDYHDWFVMRPPAGFKFFHQPGGLSPGAENLENLNQTRESLGWPLDDPRRLALGRQYYERLLETYKKHDADMLVHSKYGASRAGKPVYESYDDNAHCRYVELLKDKSGRVPVLIGYDNTGRTPAAVIAQRTDAGQWRIKYECVAESTGLKKHVKQLHRFLEEKIPNYVIQKITCDPAGIAKDSGELDMRMIVAAEFPGVTVVNARTNDVATRIDAFDGPLRRMVNGEPAMILDPECKVLRAACTNKYQYRRVKLAGEERYTEEPDKTAKPYDDVANAAQYLCLGGGEGRVNSDGANGKEPKWPTNGAAITPKPTEAALKRSQGPVFDPRSGSIFNERW